MSVTGFFARFATRTVLNWVIGVGSVALLGGAAYGVHWVRAWDRNRFTIALDAQRDSIKAASAQVVKYIAPRIEHDTIEVVKWRKAIGHAQDSARLASARVDTALTRLSESAKADTTVRALVGAVRELQADTARLFAAILTERRAVDSLRLDYSAGLQALGVRIVTVQDSMQRVIDQKTRALHRLKVWTVVTNIGSAALGVAGTYLAMRKP